MSFLAFILLLVIGILCGLVAERLIGYGTGTLLGTSIVGILGALFGSWFARAAGLPQLLPVHVERTTVDILWAVIGSVVVLAVVAAARRATRTGPRV